MAISPPERRSRRTERVDFDALLDVMDWRQGEHVTLIGPTGCGKTTLINELIQERDYNLFLGTKREDSTQQELADDYGFQTVPSIEAVHPDIGTDWIIRPPFPKSSDASDLQRIQRQTFRDVLLRAYHEGAWTVWADEVRYIADYLKLTDELILLWMQGRSQGNTLIASTQRPRFIPMEAYDQATHLFIWRDTDMQNIRRVAEMSGVNTNTLQRAVKSLDRKVHDFVYVKPHEEIILISQVER